MRIKITKPTHRNPGTARKVVAAGLIVWAVYLLVDLALALFLGLDGLPPFGFSTMTVAAFYPHLLADDWGRNLFFHTWASVVIVAFISLAWTGWRRNSCLLAWCFVTATLGSTGVALVRMALSYAGIKC